MNELEAFIASSEDDSEEEEEDRALAVQKYRALLLATPDVATAALEEEEEEQEYVPNVPVKKDRKKPTPVNLAAEPSTSKPKKTKRSAKKQEAEEDEVKLDVGDERLAGLFTEPEFMDQTDPRYKPTKTTKTINEERRKRIKIRD
ncbi:hypothetical protein BASA81_015610 [Batrachochytrium salamandrivorans]|nr:hypothetical protein BASA81_015610 [Batrachochytrium salamandrivorans]